MKKVYMKYDDIKSPVACEYGIASRLIVMGCIYTLIKKDYRMTTIILGVKLLVLAISLCMIPFPLSLIVYLIFHFIINLMFAFNYNMIEIEYLIKRGYYPMDYNSSKILMDRGIYFKLQ